MKYVFKTIDYRTGESVLDSNDKDLEINHSKVSIEITTKGKLVCRNERFIIYKNKKYIFIDMPTEKKDDIGRMVPIPCIFQLDDTDSNKDVLIKTEIERFAHKVDYLILESDYDELKKLLYDKVFKEDEHYSLSSLIGLIDIIISGFISLIGLIGGIIKLLKNIWRKNVDKEK